MCIALMTTSGALRSGMEDIGFDRAELVVVKQDSINKETPV